jgi:hypothetical protein
MLKWLGSWTPANTDAFLCCPNAQHEEVGLWISLTGVARWRTELATIALRIINFGRNDCCTACLVITNILLTDDIYKPRATLLMDFMVSIWLGIVIDVVSITHQSLLDAVCLQSTNCSNRTIGKIPHNTTKHTRSNSSD